MSYDLQGLQLRGISNVLGNVVVKARSKSYLAVGCCSLYVLVIVY